MQPESSINQRGSAPEIGSTDIADEDDRIEGIVDKGIGNDVISWVRKFRERGDYGVRFDEKVKVRPIPAEGRGRSCRGPSGLERRGRWPGRSSKRTSIGKQDDDEVNMDTMDQ